MKFGLLLMKNVLTPVAKKVFIPLFLQMEEFIKKLFESLTFCSGTTIMITSNDRMKDKMKIIDSFEYSDLLLKDIPQTIKKETREQRGGFLGI